MLLETFHLIEPGGPTVTKAHMDVCTHTALYLKELC